MVFFERLNPCLYFQGDLFVPPLQARDRRQYGFRALFFLNCPQLCSMFTNAHFRDKIY